MDFIVSYHLYNKIKKEERCERRERCEERQGEQEERKKETKPFLYEKLKLCVKCGQGNYFCQCKENKKSMYHNFNPEKDNY
tara:strand:+ start:3292 stop:3534 length:243 start_codon:yes stop_codon:yes gene_type:complete